MARRLKAIPELHDAYINYCDEIRGKLDKYISSYSQRPEASKQLSQIAKGSDFESPAFATLVSENLLSIESIKHPDTAKALKQQIRGLFFDYYDRNINDKGQSGAGPAKTTQAV
jgi:hypothetical protein